MIKLYSFGNSFGVVDPSPFVAKVDVFLRMAKLPYETIVSQKNLGKAPKGKLPFIDDKGQSIGDSEFIIEYLTKEYHLKLDDFLSSEQQAQAYLLTKSLDENLYWCLVYSRWVLEDTWPLVREVFFGKVPVPFKWFVPNMIQKKVKKNLFGQGLGRHSESEVLAICDKSFAALSTLLGDKTYFFGDQPSSFDASAYGILSSFISVELNNPFNQQARKYDNLVAYCQRIEANYY